MNKERILDLADFLAQHPEQHDQAQWMDEQGDFALYPKDLIWRAPECGTVGCAAGWAWANLSAKEQLAVVDQWERVEGFVAGTMSWATAGRLTLDLTNDEAKRLFGVNYMGGVTDMMVDALREFAETGVLPESDVKCRYCGGTECPCIGEDTSVDGFDLYDCISRDRLVDL